MLICKLNVHISFSQSAFLRASFYKRIYLYNEIDFHTGFLCYRVSDNITVKGELSSQQMNTKKISDSYTHTHTHTTRQERTNSCLFTAIIESMLCTIYMCVCVHVFQYFMLAYSLYLFQSMWMCWMCVCVCVHWQHCTLCDPFYKSTRINFFETNQYWVRKSSTIIFTRIYAGSIDARLPFSKSQCVRFFLSPHLYYLAFLCIANLFLSHICFLFSLFYPFTFCFCNFRFFISILFHFSLKPCLSSSLCAVWFYLFFESIKKNPANGCKCVRRLNIVNVILSHCHAHSLFSFILV